MLPAQPPSLLPLLPPGTLGEISGALGSGRTSLALRMLHASRTAVPSRERIAWVATDSEAFPYPIALQAAGWPPERCLRVRAQDKELYGSARLLLRSGLFSAILVDAPLPETVELRRLQIAAEKSDTTFLFLTEKLKKSVPGWPLALRIEVMRSPESGQVRWIIHQHKKRTRVVQHPGPREVAS